MALVECADVAFSYEGNTVVTDLNFKINGGDYIYVVGENGSGKSTLIKGILKLKAPSKGIIKLNGIKATDIGYLPQQTQAQKDFPASAYEVVLSGRLNSRGLRPFYNSEDRAAAILNMGKLDIANLKHSCYRELSSGQQQRVLLARALCAAKRMLILDEPVSDLDPVAAHELYRLVELINKDYGITIIMVSHDISAATKYASHILHLNNKQAYFGSIEGYIKTEVGSKFTGDKKYA